jgi:photosystem II stability/assembly factor-like uncharacterized protein
METWLFVATQRGFVVCERNHDGWRESARSLAGRNVTSVIAREGVILAGTTEGIHRSDDGGQTWNEASDGLDVRHVRWLAYHPDLSDREFAGTEPASIFVSHDGARSWRACPEVAELRDRHRWFLPYSPQAGCVRGFTFHGDRAYAAVEVGGVLRSDDTGETWRLAGGSTGEPALDIPQRPMVHSDVHSIAVHPSSPALVFGATAEGLYCSSDGGDTWAPTHLGSYCRAFWVDPADPERIILSPADSVRHKNGRIEESRDGGRSWTLASDGLDLPWPHRMVERFFQIGVELFAVTNDGSVHSAPMDRLEWRRILPDVDRVNAIAWG